MLQRFNNYLLLLLPLALAERDSRSSRRLRLVPLSLLILSVLCGIPCFRADLQAPGAEKPMIGYCIGTWHRGREGAGSSCDSLRLQCSEWHSGHVGIQTSSRSQYSWSPVSWQSSTRYQYQVCVKNLGVKKSGWYISKFKKLRLSICAPRETPL